MMNNNCDCNDYSLLTAKTGIASISDANPSLQGIGATKVITGAANGTVVKSIIIKATGESLTGMVRFFVNPTPPSFDLSPQAQTPKALYREIPIPTWPSTPAIPLPLPVWQTIEIDLLPGLTLQNNVSLFASTEVANTFNIIAEGVDFSYPDPLPATCCNFKQEIVLTGVGSVSKANPNTDGTGDIVNLYTVTTGVNGAVIKNITITALQSTHPGMIRFFISPDAGTTYYLWMECSIPESIQSAFTPSFKRVLEKNLYLQADYIIAVSTQNSENFAITVQGEEWTYPI